MLPGAHCAHFAFSAGPAMCLDAPRAEPDVNVSSAVGASEGNMYTATKPPLPLHT